MLKANVQIKILLLAKQEEYVVTAAIHNNLYVK
jgi:hypothetical protein